MLASIASAGAVHMLSDHDVADALAGAAVHTALAWAAAVEVEEAEADHLRQVVECMLRHRLLRWRWHAKVHMTAGGLLLSALGRKLFWESLSARPLRRLLSRWKHLAELQVKASQCGLCARAMRLCQAMEHWRCAAHVSALQRLGVYRHDVYAYGVGARLRAIHQWQALLQDAAIDKLAVFSSARRSFRRAWLSWVALVCGSAMCLPPPQLCAD